MKFMLNPQNQLFFPLEWSKASLFIFYLIIPLCGRKSSQDAFGIYRFWRWIWKSCNERITFLVAGIVNRGDSFRRRRSRSNSLCPPAMGGGAQTPSPVLDDHHVMEVSNYTVALLGAQGVGKTALISQFMTSECINAYERQKGEGNIGN